MKILDRRPDVKPVEMGRRPKPAHLVEMERGIWHIKQALACVPNANEAERIAAIVMETIASTLPGTEKQTETDATACVGFSLEELQECVDKLRESSPDGENPALDRALELLNPYVRVLFGMGNTRATPEELQQALQGSDPVVVMGRPMSAEAFLAALAKIEPFMYLGQTEEELAAKIKQRAEGIIENTIYSAIEADKLIERPPEECLAEMRTAKGTGEPMIGVPAELDKESEIFLEETHGKAEDVRRPAAISRRKTKTGASDLQDRTSRK